MITYDYMKLCVPEPLDLAIKADVDLVVKYVGVVVDNLTRVEFSADLTEAEAGKIDAIVAAHNNALIGITASIDNAITYFQSVAPSLIKELYIENTLAGITTVQSDQMFDDYLDVLTRLREGAFPTAAYRLQQKVPSGFVTQPLIDAWILKINFYLGI